VTEYLKKQRRFKHLTEDNIQTIQQDVDKKWSKFEG